MAEEYPLGFASRSSRIKCRCRRIFVEVFELKPALGGIQHGFIFDHAIIGYFGFFTIVEINQFRGPLESIPDPFDDGQKIRMHQDHIVFGMIDGIEYLLGRESDIDRMQYRAHHWNREKTLQVAMIIVVHHRYSVSFLHSYRSQAACELVYALGKYAVGITRITADNFLFGRAGQRRVQQVPDQQRIVIGRSSVCLDHFIMSSISLYSGPILSDHARGDSVD